MSDQLLQMQEMLKKSLVTIKRLESELEASKKHVSNIPIAIVGVGVRLPGGITHTEQLWDTLVQKSDKITTIPSSRWDNSKIYDEDPLKPGKTNANHGGFLTNDVTAWDAEYFGTVPREAKSIDPLQRMILEVTLEAFESAGIASDSLKGSKTGVYIALGNSDYMSARLRSGNLEDVDVYDTTGIPFATAAGRLSYLYDFRGPNFALDAACASSIVGLHLASEDLKAKRADHAVVAAANLILTPELYVGLSKLGSLSTEGKCKAFDEHADGYVRGEGCGVVILKRLEDAERDNDNILCIIKGSSVKHDGTSNGFTAPNPEAQVAVIQEALEVSGVLPEEVSFVEAHGIGNKFTDAMEIQAIENGYKHRNNPIYIGSLKPNIGHLEAAIGMGMLFKVIETLKHHQIAPNIHITTPNTDIDWEHVHAKIPTETIDWKGSSQMKVAINLSGYSGTNVHMIFEEAPKKESKGLPPTYPLNVFYLSSKSLAGLKALAQKYLDEQENWKTLPFHNICYTLQTGRNHYDYKLAIVASSIETVLEALQSYTSGENHKSLIVNDPENIPAKDSAFLFTGQGAQYYDMCKNYYEQEPVFKAAFDQCNKILSAHLPISIKDILFNHEDQTLINQTQYTQPGLFVVEYALAKLWQSFGIQPSAVFGHSVGEFVALTIAEAIHLEDALRLIAARGKFMQSLPEDIGAMAAVIASVEEIQPHLSGYEGKVSIAAANSPKSTTISGEKEAIQIVIERLKEAKIKAIPLTVSHAFHSHLMDPILQDFENEVAKTPFHTPQIPVISNVLNRELTISDLTPSYFSNHLRRTVRFEENMQFAHQELGIEIFIETGPNPTLAGLGKQSIANPTITWVHSAKKGSDDITCLMMALAQLSLSGIKVNWQQLYAGKTVEKVSMPTYAWQRKSYWYDPVRINYAATTQSNITDKASKDGYKIAHTSGPLTRETFYQIMHKEGNRVLGLEKSAKLDDHKSLRDQGFDSMMSGEYLTALEKYLNTTLDISLLHIYINLHDLHDYLCKKYIDNSTGGVLMNDIILGNVLEDEEEEGNWHDVKPTDGWLLRLFKRIDAKLPTINN